jgi:predicted nucleic acid-binding protein
MLALLRALFPRILIPPAVQGEIEAGHSGVAELVGTEWIEVRAPSDVAMVARLARTVDRAEAEALALAIELSCTVLLDDTEARQLATTVGVSHMNTGNVLVMAKDRGWIDRVRPAFDQMAAAGVHLNRAIIRAALRAAGELP